MKDLLQEIREGQAGNVGEHVGEHVGDRAGDHTEMVLFILQKQPKATARSIAELTHLSVRQAERILASLRDQGKIRRNGSARSGEWEVLNKR